MCNVETVKEKKGEAGTDTESGVILNLSVNYAIRKQTLDTKCFYCE